uniref:Reverse transcriptase domain-containing protein n=1 Tax=Oryzias latipes TaxID=8090 RepID=A0A3P9HSL1_ORYLA
MGSVDQRLSRSSNDQRVGGSIPVNELKTGWFSTPFGVKQGDVLSPTLFSIYVNDLAQEIKKTNLADEEIKLQGMLNTMNDWCNKWRLTINSDKTQIVHFRKPLVPQSNFLFYFGETTLMFTDTYKYLGFVFHKNMIFSEGKQLLSDCAGMALGTVINKMKVLNEGTVLWVLCWDFSKCCFSIFASEILTFLLPLMH